MESETAVLIRFLDFGKAVKGGAYNVFLFGGSNFGRHTVADFASAHYEHSASPQFLMRNTVKVPFFIRIIRLEVLYLTQLRADGNISQFINLAAVASEQTRRGFSVGTDMPVPKVSTSTMTGSAFPMA